MQLTNKTIAFLRTNAAGLVALFVVLGGSAFAASQGSGPGRNSVGPQQIKANAVGSSEIRNDAVRSGELADGAVGSAEITDSSLSLQDLNFQVPQRGDIGLRGTTETSSLNLSGLGFSTVATQEFTPAPNSAALVMGQVTFTDIKDGNASSVELRVLHNDQVVGGAVFADTIADGTSTTAPVSIQDSGFRPGSNTISIEVRMADGASNVVVGSRALQIVQFGPIFHPPG